MAESRGDPHLLWVYPESLIAKMDAATWLETTRELRNASWRVTLVSGGLDGRREVSGVEIVCISSSKLYVLRHLAYHIKLIRLLAHEWNSTDVVMFHPMSALWILPFGLVKGLIGGQRPLLVMDTRTVHMAPNRTPVLRDRTRGSYLRLMNWLGSQFADGQTAITLRMAEEIRIPKEQFLGDWPSGVRLGTFSESQRLRNWPRNEEPIRLTYTGRLDYERNLVALCKAIEAAAVEGMEFRLALVGYGSQGQELERIAANSNGRIEVIPPVPHSQMPALLSEAHVGVLPFPDEPKFRVSSPIKLFEYMASGMPILATKIACHTDVVGQGDYVFWAQDSSVEELVAGCRAVWSGRQSLEFKGQKAVIAASDWTWERSAERLSASLKKGLARSALVPQT